MSRAKPVDFAISCAISPEQWIAGPSPREKRELDSVVARLERCPVSPAALYLSFFGLGENPFTTTPDLRFLYLGARHREAFARLQYSAEANSLEERTGIIVLTGDVGTGKTTLLQALRHKLGTDTAISYVLNSTLPCEAILEYVLEELGIAKAEKSPAQRLIAFNNFLLERERAGQSTVLIIDEAQNLNPSTLLQIGMLANFEGETSKLLQIVLVGQPELEATLDLPALRELRQRIGLRCRLRALSRKEVHEYLHNRLQIAGAPDPALFDEAAINRITRYSGGIPRTINILADHCLLIGYANEKRRIDRRIVDEAISYLEEGGKSPRSGFRWAPVGVALASAVTGFVLSADLNVRRFLLALMELLTGP
jgi:general secretion pathway protein A